MGSRRTLEGLAFDNTYARQPEAFYSKLNPTPFSDPPYLVSFNPDAAALLDLDPGEAGRPEFPQCFGGGLLMPGSEPLAMLYSGHQLGVYVSRLGDGRAILLGEVRNEAGQKWDLHLKGAGQTPYSRDGDGRAVLRSSIREYLCSEAMHGLGIPTTRALCIVGSEDKVYRETAETGAMLVRLAPSHVRFGNFEVFYYRRQHDHLARLADYVIEHHFPHLLSRPDKMDKTDQYVGFFQEVVTLTARLIAKWQAVGWAHGVMNTDNMSIHGITLDYGPFGFMDEYDPGFICNHSDHHGRYAFDRQPYIGLWNLSCLAEALLPLASKEPLKAALDTYESTLNRDYTALMCEKLGLHQQKAEDGTLVTDLLSLMQRSRADYTNVFRALGSCVTRTHSATEREGKTEGGPGGEAPRCTNEYLRDMFVDREAFDAWTARYRDRLLSEGSRDDERLVRMSRVNPNYVLRNYLAQHAIEKAQQRDYSEINRLLDLLRDPYTDRPDMEPYAAAPPDSGKHLIVSCSS